MQNYKQFDYHGYLRWYKLKCERNCQQSLLTKWHALIW
jgi:hypothetical protein